MWFSNLAVPIRLLYDSSWRCFWRIGSENGKDGRFFSADGTWMPTWCQGWVSLSGQESGELGSSKQLLGFEVTGIGWIGYPELLSAEMDCNVYSRRH